MSAKRAAFALITVIAAAGVVAASGCLGWWLERTLRPPVRGAGSHEDTGRLRASEFHELEDRVVSLVRAGAPADTVSRALRPLEAAHGAYDLSPDAIVTRRVTWWRARIAGVPPEYRAYAISRARSLGLTDDELDPLARIVDPASDADGGGQHR